MASRVVLVVEDDVLVRIGLAAGLRDAGYHVVEAASADEALAVLQTGETVDAVFTDWEMPGRMNGLALSLWIRLHRPGMPVFLTSGAGKVGAGSDAIPFVPKPYDLDDVARRIALAIEGDDRDR